MSTVIGSHKKYEFPNDQGGYICDGCKKVTSPFTAIVVTVYVGQVSNDGVNGSPLLVCIT